MSPATENCEIRASACLCTGEGHIAAATWLFSVALWKPEHLRPSLRKPPSLMSLSCLLLGGCQGSPPDRALYLRVAGSHMVGQEGRRTVSNYGIWRLLTHSSFVLLPCTSYPLPQQQHVHTHIHGHTYHTHIAEKRWALLGRVSPPNVTDRWLLGSTPSGPS